MAVVVSWDGPGAQRGKSVVVTTVAELDAALARVAGQAAEEELPYGVQVWNEDLRTGVMFGLGHPERSFIDWFDRNEPHGVGDRYAVREDLPPVAEPIGFDIYGNWSERNPRQTRVTPADATGAARSFLLTGARPTNVTWTDESPS